MNNTLFTALSRLGHSVDADGESQISRRRFDQGILWGAILALIFLVLAFVAAGSVSRFINPLGFLIVIGGTFAATLMQFSLDEMGEAWQAFRAVILARSQSALQRILLFVDLSQKIRRGTIIVLDEEAQKIADPFLRKGLEMTVDGADEVLLRR